MDSPSLGVIIPSFGREEALLNNVSDLLLQTIPPNEILVILQKPNQGIKAVDDLRALSLKHPHFKLHEVDFANAQKARNLGIKSAQSDILLILDDDLRIPSNLVAAHLKNFRDDPQIDGVVGQVLENGQNPTDELPASYSWPWLGWQNLPLNFSRRTITHNWPSTNSSIKRHLAIKAGGFDEQFDRTWLDDSDFSVRLIHEGANLIFDPQATVLHLKVPTGGKRPESSIHMILNDEGWGVHFYFWRKNYGLWKSRYPLWAAIRYYLLRKWLLLRPKWFLRNWIEFFKGWKIASLKLREGPVYLAYENP